MSDPNEKEIIKCPHCKTDAIKTIDLHTEWGYENGFVCKKCGILFMEPEL